MPQRAVIDWTFAYALFLKEFTAKEIAEKLGQKLPCIAAHINRHKWVEKRNKLREELQITANHSVRGSAAQAVTQVDAVIEKYKNSVISVLNPAIAQLEKKGKRNLSLKDIDVLSRALETLDKVGRRTHGLDAENGRSQIGLRQTIVIQAPPSATVNVSSQVVDISPKMVHDAATSKGNDLPDTTGGS